MDRGSVEIYRALNPDRYESIRVLSRICRRQNHLDGSRFYRESMPNRNFLDGSRSYQDKVQEAIENVIRSVEKRSLKGLIDRKLSRIW